MPNFIILLAIKGPKIFLLERVKKLHVNSSAFLKILFDFEINFSCTIGYLTVLILALKSLIFFIIKTLLDDVSNLSFKINGIFICFLILSNLDFLFTIIVDG